MEMGVTCIGHWLGISRGSGAPRAHVSDELTKRHFMDAHLRPHGRLAKATRMQVNTDTRPGDP